MLRQDYLLRLVAELMQVLLGVASLRHRGLHEQALREVDEALRRLRNMEVSTAPPQEEFEAWITWCQHPAEEIRADLMLAVARLWRERSQLLKLRDQPEATRDARIVALGLFLEAVLNQGAMVSGELLDEIEGLGQETAEAERPGGLLHRLMLYFEARGHYGRAEDVLFEWADVCEPDARERLLPVGKAFYERLLELSDPELEQGNLPRSELESGRKEWLHHLV